MVDNVNVTPGTGEAIAADDIAGIKHQRVKVVIGANGVNDGDISSSNPMPISGTVTANTGLTQPLTDTQLRASSVPVSGSVSVSNFPATQPVSGTVSIANLNNIVSTLNSTSSLLLANATYTGSSEDILQYAECVVSLVTDRNGALSIQYSHDGSNWHHTQNYTITAAVPGTPEGFIFSVMIEARYFRLVYTNGATNQGTFSIQTILKTTTSNSEIQSLSQPVLDNTDSLVTKGLIFGKTTGGGGGYVPVKVTPSGALTTESAVVSSALPAGAATSAKQDTKIASLASIDSKLTSSATEATLAGIKAVTDRLEFGNDGRIRTGQETLLFFDQINGNTINSELWKAASSVITTTQTNGTLILNNGISLAANGYYNLTSTKSFNRVFEYPIYSAAQFRYTVSDTQKIEMGFLTAATNAAPTDGFFFRIDSTGIHGVCNIGGVETSSLITGPTAGTDYYSDLVIHDRSVFFEIQDINGNKYETTIPFLPSASSNARLGVSYRIYNGATPATTPATLYIYSVSVIQMDWAAGKSYDEQMATATHNFCQVEPNTFIKTANWTNSAAPGAATLSNTAAGYTTLGGYFRFTTTASAATDYALFAYQVPVGYSLILNQIGIDSAVTTAMGATATVMSWAVGLGASAVSLATTDAWPTSSASKFVPVGFQSLLASAPIGTTATPLSKHFDVPIVVEGGDYFHIILRIINGSTTGQITGMVAIDGYFE